MVNNFSTFFESYLVVEGALLDQQPHNLYIPHKSNRQALLSDMRLCLYT